MGQKWDIGTIEQARTLREQGKTFREVEDETGIPRSTLSRLLSQSRQPGASGTDLAQPRVQEQLDELRALVLELQEQLKPILRERAKAKERLEDEYGAPAELPWRVKK